MKAFPEPPTTMTVWACIFKSIGNTGTKQTLSLTNRRTVQLGLQEQVRQFYFLFYFFYNSEKAIDICASFTAGG